MAQGSCGKYGSGSGRGRNYKESGSLSRRSKTSDWQKRNWSGAGSDKIRNYWWKKLTVVHEQIAEAYENIINDAREIDIEWLVMGETQLIPKEGDWSAANQRHITLLNTCYKWVTSVLKEKMENTWQNLHHCVRSVSFGSRVLLILILFYTLLLLETPAADINDSRECLGLTSKCITSTNFQIFEEIGPRKNDCKFVSFNFSVDICISYSQKKQTSHPRDSHLIQSLGQRQNPLECKWNNKQIQRIIFSFRFKKRFLTRKPILYYCNSTSTQQISLISWTVEANPGPTYFEKKIQT